MKLAVKIVPDVEELQFCVSQNVESIRVFPSQFFGHVETVYEPIFASLSLSLFDTVDDVCLHNEREQLAKEYFNKSRIWIRQRLWAFKRVI